MTNFVTSFGRPTLNTLHSVLPRYRLYLTSYCGQTVSEENRDEIKDKQPSGSPGQEYRLAGARGLWPSTLVLRHQRPVFHVGGLRRSGKDKGCANVKE